METIAGSGFRWGRFFWIFASGVGALLCVTVLLTSCVRNKCIRDLESRLAALRTQGRPASWDELLGDQSPVAEADNAAAVYGSAFEIITNKVEYSGHTVQEAMRGDYGYWEHEPSLREAVIRLRPALDQLRMASAMNQCRFALRQDHGKRVNPHALPMSISFRLLLCASALAARDGDNVSAISDAIAAARMVDCGRESPDTVTQLIRYGMMDRLYIMMAQGLFRDIDWTPDSLRRLRNGLPETMLAPSLAEQLEWDRLNFLAYCPVTESVAGTGVYKMKAAPADSDNMIRNLKRAYFPTVIMDFIQGFDLYEDTIAQLKTADYTERRNALDINAKLDSLPDYCSTTRVLFMDVSAFEIQQVTSEVELLILKAVVQVELFRIEHGTPPAALETAGAECMDLFSGNSVEYGVSPDGEFYFFCAGPDALKEKKQDDIRWPMTAEPAKPRRTKKR